MLNPLSDKSDEVERDTQYRIERAWRFHSLSGIPVFFTLVYTDTESKILLLLYSTKSGAFYTWYCVPGTCDIILIRVPWTQVVSNKLPRVSFDHEPNLASGACLA